MPRTVASPAMEASRIDTMSLVMTWHSEAAVRIGPTFSGFLESQFISGCRRKWSQRRSNTPGSNCSTGPSRELRWEKILHDSAYGDLLRKTNRKFCIVFPTPGFGLPIKHVWRGQWRNPQHIPLILQLWVLFTELHKALDVEDHDVENVARVSETQFFIKTASLAGQVLCNIFPEKKNVWNSRTPEISGHFQLVHPEISHIHSFPDIRGDAGLSGSRTSQRIHQDPVVATPGEKTLGCALINMIIWYNII